MCNQQNVPNLKGDSQSRDEFFTLCQHHADISFYFTLLSDPHYVTVCRYCALRVGMWETLQQTLQSTSSQINNLLYNFLGWTRFQLTGTCDRALTVLTHIFPSPLRPSTQTPLYPLIPFRRAVEQAVRPWLRWVWPLCDTPTQNQWQKGNSWWMSSSFTKTNDIVLIVVLVEKVWHWQFFNQQFFFF